MSQFNGKSYMTKGFASTVPISVQFMIFTMLDEHVKKSKQSEMEIDYLQVFELNTTAFIYLIHIGSLIKIKKRQPMYGIHTKGCRFIKTISILPIFHHASAAHAIAFALA